eukprot:CAMPEP_0195532570 /NCGR_PEP_ID=MMETSP0794_2-20130614/38526_1 /TAXON_ID=515487 /ORGANISM="Stephanopyxis turris, Strain CCMP 815" /LENGTH=148 /DNA_ID=CAMNT_0040664839 /DNA_START=204 /DNA_END=650 /DNA_ORIENTATION=-
MVPPQSASFSSRTNTHQFLHYDVTPMSIIAKKRVVLYSGEGGGEGNGDEFQTNDFEIVRLDDDDLSDDLFDEISENAPPVGLIMKQLLGINIFTYVLAGLIVIFLSLNAMLGPGWLGQKIGLEGTGTFTEISDKFPLNVDLSNQENLL